MIFGRRFFRDCWPAWAPLLPYSLSQCLTTLNPKTFFHRHGSFWAMQETGNRRRAEDWGTATSEAGLAHEINQPLGAIASYASGCLPTVGIRHG